MSTSTAEMREHVPRRPAPGKRAIKVNLFEQITRNVGTLQLVPLFPYLDDGAIVPCLSITKGGQALEPFQFFHANVVSESILCVAEQGATMKAGQLIKATPVHGVNTFLKKPSDPESFYVVIVTVRMLADAVQQEGFIIRCAKCTTIVYQRDFDVKQGPQWKYYPEFYALRYYAECCEEFNADEVKRRCPKCGLVQKEFPIRQMGWRLYADNVEVANRGREALEQAGRQQMAGAAR
jgi:hypothetical protein